MNILFECLFERYDCQSIQGVILRLTIDIVITHFRCHRSRWL